MTSEMRALDNLAGESDAAGRVLHYTNLMVALEADYHPDEYRKDSLLGEYNEHIHKGKIAEEDYHLDSRRAFAKSIGIKPKTDFVQVLGPDKKPVINPETKKPKIRPVVIAEDPTQQALLDKEYIDFRDKYFGAKNFKVLDARRKELQVQMAAVGAVTASARSQG
jgi:hypothetical protein